jgi:hypothetical protein
MIHVVVMTCVMIPFTILVRLPLLYNIYFVFMKESRALCTKSTVLLCTPQVRIGGAGMYLLIGGWVGLRTDLIALEKRF